MPKVFDRDKKKCGDWNSQCESAVQRSAGTPTWAHLLNQVEAVHNLTSWSAEAWCVPEEVDVLVDDDQEISGNETHWNLWM